jgi:uncharacterized protein (DUF1684 family)
MSGRGTLVRMTAPFVLVFLVMIAVQAAWTRGDLMNSSSADSGSYDDEILAWRKSRVRDLTGEDGWLALAGLYWLQPGKNTFGTSDSRDIVLPAGKAPEYAGSILIGGGSIRIEAAPGAGITSDGKTVGALELHSDEAGKPTVLKLGPLSFHVIKRGDKLGLRVKDRDNPERLAFRGLDYFPIDPGWRLEGTFVPYDPPKSIPITNILGMVEDQQSPGAIRFQVAGATFQLDAVTEQGSEELFIMFADKTTGTETYGSGRYLYAPMPSANGKTVIDFNKAYNPPCAFTRFATCPLPPRQNRLPIGVQAGEKKYAGGSH